MPAAETNPMAALTQGFALFERVPSLLIAVSGGSDSVALTRLLHQWCAHQPHAPRLYAATVDHGLRAEAKGEACFVGQLCQKLDIPHQILTWQGDKPRSGVQAAARQARYGLLQDHALHLGVRHIATAHTADDQAETVLMRLLRGSGLKGLAGMRPHSALKEAVLLRPLLGVQRQSLRAWLQGQQADWVEDPSNEDARYTRARLRQIFPVLEAEGLDKAVLCRLAARCSAAEEALQQVAHQFIAVHVGNDGLSLRLERALLALQPSAVRCAVLQKLIETQGGKGQKGYGVQLIQVETLDARLHEDFDSTGELSRFCMTLGGCLVRGGARYVRISSEKQRKTPVN